MPALQGSEGAGSGRAWWQTARILQALKLCTDRCFGAPNARRPAAGLLSKAPCSTRCQGVMMLEAPGFGGGGWLGEGGTLWSRQARS